MKNIDRVPKRAAAAASRWRCSLPPQSAHPAPEDPAVLAYLAILGNRSRRRRSETKGMEGECGGSPGALGAMQRRGRVLSSSMAEVREIAGGTSPPTVARGRLGAAAHSL